MSMLLEERINNKYYKEEVTMAVAERELDNGHFNYGDGI